MAKAAAAPAQQPNDSDLMDDKGAFSGGVQDEDKGGKEPTKKSEPERVKVKIGDAELETDPGSAAALNSLLQMNAQLQQLVTTGYRAPAGTEPPAKKATSDDYDYETGLFTEPKIALERLRQQIKAEVKSEMTATYTAAETKKEFWAGFYNEHADLKDEKLIVNAVMERDFKKLASMTTEDAAKAIATAAKKEIMRLSGGKSKSDPDGDQNQIEGGSNKNPPSSKQKDSKDAPQSLSDVIRSRQAARRKAQFSKE